MDYIYNDMIIEEKTSQENLNSRLLIYAKMLQTSMCDKDECDERNGNKYFIDILGDKESKWEQSIYNKLKGWERRHSIMGIVFCTILGGILISLIAGVILEAILICV